MQSHGITLSFIARWQISRASPVGPDLTGSLARQAAPKLTRCFRRKGGLFSELEIDHFGMAVTAAEAAARHIARLIRASL
jgi:hypothetical protein